ncbi:MAG: type II toxin-antitoxin system RelE/ParE family toxin [Prevotella sp.]|nr:type II toxin-antitoxin system RelE/ParE family toxin [Prevotella sp.]
MAEVKWTKRAQKAKRALYLNGLEQFGAITAEKTLRKVTTIAADLAKWPTSGHPEQLLLGESPLYRAKPINDRFRIIYWYDEENDTVVIEDIWDTRRNPETLKQRMT